MGRSTLLSEMKRPSRKCSLTKKAWNRGQLLRILEGKRLITRIGVDANLKLSIEHVGWDDYWLPVIRAGQSDEALKRLKSAWAAYLDSGFDGKLRRVYCLRYFELLDALTRIQPANRQCSANREALRRVLAFETFGVFLPGQNEKVVAGATSTSRHPAYLLAKLKTPEVLDTSEHLPLILPLHAPNGTLCYHYRQHRLSRDSDIVLLTYLAADHDMRASSFQAIASLEQGIADGTDPFAKERVERIARAGVKEYLRAWCREHANTNQVLIDLIDLGAGSGLVAAGLSGEIVTTLAEMQRHPRFRMWFIDLSLSEPARFFSSESIGQYVDTIQVIGADYRQWMDQADALPVCDGIRMVVISRFFNNLSDFSVQTVSCDDAFARSGEPLEHIVSECNPTRCLAEVGPGPQQLVASTAHMRLAEGRTFRQFSLLPYFLGLKLTRECGGSPKRRENVKPPTVLPARSFRLDCLLTRSGDSLLGVLARLSNLVVVQDADLRPEDLTAHCRVARLDDLMALDTTRAVGLRGHFSYVIGKRTDPTMRDIGGERIW